MMISAEAVEPQKEPTAIDVDENIEETVEECQEIEKSARASEAGESSQHHREKKNRLSYDTEFKLKVIEEAKKNQKNDVAFKYNISKSMVSTWVKNEKKITDAAAHSHRKMMKKIRPSTRHKQVFVMLHEKFLQARSKGMRISFAWLYANARKINPEFDQSAQSDIKAIPKSAVFNFIRKYKIKLRRIQRKKRAEKTSFLPGMIGWHTTLREGLIKTGNAKPSYDSKWGRFRPSKRFNVDQVPMPFAVDCKTTYEKHFPRGEQRNHRTWVSTPGPGLDKRQCTLQICFAAEGPPVKIAIIFRGTGKRISQDEIQAYHKDVDVYWQTNAWADINFSIDWVKRTLKPAVQNSSETGENEEFVLFCDNLSAQTNDLFLSKVRKLNGVVWFGLAGATDIWQPVDCGFGNMLKSLVRTLQDEWLQSDENIDLWLGNSVEKLDVKKRRILITHWVGEAYNRLSSESYASSRYRCFEKTGCLITADGSEDKKIQPEGLIGYSIPPPLPVTGPENPLSVQIPEASAACEEDVSDEEDEGDEELEPDELEHER
eukprot:gene14944-biopygen848